MNQHDNTATFFSSPYSNAEFDPTSTLSVSERNSPLNGAWNTLPLKRFHQIFKFALVGGLNTAIDFLVLNALVYAFGTGNEGKLYPLFKAISFLAAVINSYLLNKYWVFKAEQNTSRTKEGVLFFVVSGIGFLLNVIISTAIFSLVLKAFSINQRIVINIGALAGSLLVLVWNYIGYKMIVFKK